MNIPKSCKIELVTSRDPTRSFIAEPYLDIKNGIGTLVATTGCVMAMVPVELYPDDTAGYVSGAVLKAARKVGLKRSDSVIILPDGQAKLNDGSLLPRAGSAAVDGTFPNWRQVVPKDEPVMVIALNALQLAELAQALGAEGVCLHIKSPVDPILVVPHGSTYPKPASPGARGVLMPIRI